MDEIAVKLREFIAATYLKGKNRQVTDDEPLMSSGLIDSFGLVDLTLFLEQEFGAVIDPSEISADTADTVAQIANLVAQRR